MNKMELADIFKAPTENMNDNRGMQSQKKIRWNFSAVSKKI